jgi:pyruvate dehydrogenase E1 component alpha subunit
MVLVRAFEEKLEELYQRKAMFGSTHSYRGQEAIAVGVCSALAPTDVISSYHRGTGHLIAKGADVYKLLCECMGRADGYSQGRGGKMHMGDLSFGFLGNTGTVGGTVPTATGAALAAKIRKSNEIAVSFFGDGAVNQGVVHEAMNLAGVWKLPVIYVCENNQYNEYTHYSETTAGALSARAEAFGIHTESIDGQDVRAVHAAAQSSAERARRNGGPSFLLCNTYRFHGHHVGDIDRAYYRSKKEEEDWKQRDPIALLADRLKKSRMAESKTLDAIDSEVSAEIQKAVSFALEAPYPAAEEVGQHVYA